MLRLLDRGPTTSSGTGVPGPRVPRVLQTVTGVMLPIRARLELRDRYGPVFRTNDSIIGELVHVADRDLIEEVFKWKPAQYNVGEPRQVMEPVVGPSSILLLDGGRHLRTRRLLLPPFHGEAIERYAELIEEITSREIDAWRPGQTIRARTLAQRITLEVIIRAVFGVTDAARIAELKRVLPRLSSPSPFLLLARRDLGPLSPWGRFVRLRAEVDELLYDEIRRRRDEADRDSRKDILTLLFSARDEDGEPLTERELRDELVTMLIAGHETTATSIGWAFERLLRAPAALDRLTREVRGGVSGEYLDAVVKETLRLRPVVPEVFRATNAPAQLGDYRLPAGTQVAVSIFLAQLDPRTYPPDPQVFRPERLLDGGPEPYSWIPFGGGVRRCLGAAFATLEMKVVIATILSRTTLRPRRARAERARFRGVTLLPSRGGEAIVDAIGRDDQPGQRSSLQAISQNASS